ETDALGVVHADSGRNAVENEAQLAFALLQGRLRPLEILDVVADTVPADDLAIVVAHRHAAPQMPAVGAVGHAGAILALERLFLCQPFLPAALDTLEIVRMQRMLPIASGSVATEFDCLPAGSNLDAVGIKDAHSRRDAVEDEARFQFTCGERLLGALEILDVV